MSQYLSSKDGIYANETALTFSYINFILTVLHIFFTATNNKDEKNVLRRLFNESNRHCKKN